MDHFQVFKLIFTFSYPLPGSPAVCVKLPQQSQSSVLTMWRRTTTSQFLGCPCLALPVPPHSPRAPAAPASLLEDRRGPCCRTAWGRTAGTMDLGLRIGVQETLWLAATPALSFCPRLPRTRPPWMTARALFPAHQNRAMPCFGRDISPHPVHPPLGTAPPGVLPMPSGPSRTETYSDFLTWRKSVIK